MPPECALHSVCSRNLIHSICLLLNLFLSLQFCYDSFSSHSAILSAMTLMRRNKHYFFFLEHFYCIPTWADKNESDIRAQTTAVFTWTYFSYIYQSHEICKFIVLLASSTGPAGKLERDRQQFEPGQGNKDRCHWIMWRKGISLAANLEVRSLGWVPQEHRRSCKLYVSYTLASCLSLNSLFSGHIGELHFWKTNKWTIMARRH